VDVAAIRAGISAIGMHVAAIFFETKITGSAVLKTTEPPCDGTTAPMMGLYCERDRVSE
jgi:hypothetical protein